MTELLRQKHVEGSDQSQEKKDRPSTPPSQEAQWAANAAITSMSWDLVGDWTRFSCLD